MPVPCTACVRLPRTSRARVGLPLRLAIEYYNLHFLVSHPIAQAVTIAQPSTTRQHHVWLYLIPPAACVVDGHRDGTAPRGCGALPGAVQNRGFVLDHELHGGWTAQA